MKIIKKFPINPNIVIFLLPKEQTKKMSESYSKKETALEHEYAWKFLEIEGIRRIQITRYEIRVYKQKTEIWENILPQILELIKNIFKTSTIFDFEKYNLEKNSLTIQINTGVEKREVYEGVDCASGNFFAKYLFTIPGIERVIIDRNNIEIKKSNIFSKGNIWTKIFQWKNIHKSMKQER